MARPRALQEHDAISIAAARAVGLLWKQIAWRLGVSKRTAYRAARAFWHPAPVEGDPPAAIVRGHACGSTSRTSG